MKNVFASPPGFSKGDEVTERSNVEVDCLAKIESNLRCIAQFRENSANIGPVLRAKFEKNIIVLENKNARLLKQIEDSKTA